MHFSYQSIHLDKKDDSVCWIQKEEITTHKLKIIYKHPALLDESDTATITIHINGKIQGITESIKLDDNRHNQIASIIENKIKELKEFLKPPQDKKETQKQKSQPAA